MTYKRIETSFFPLGYKELKFKLVFIVSNSYRSDLQTTDNLLNTFSSVTIVITAKK